MSEEAKYEVKIIMRDFQGQTRDDYHATVTRLSDGEQLVFISDWKWWLKLKTCRWRLDREFNYHDRHKKKLAEKEVIRR